MTSMTAATPTAPRPADVEVPAWATQADERQTLPPITCTPWCVDGGGGPRSRGSGERVAAPSQPSARPPSRH